MGVFSKKKESTIKWDKIDKWKEKSSLDNPMGRIIEEGDLPSNLHRDDTNEG